ncbi:probable WRKY transcription factor 46 [Euphorbia lathyris]|uniref:probable WRKY transcription factor 46 n=1 Tax=Euphorbia lathyris TaxID=212925 RepID=UPI003314458F
MDMEHNILFNELSQGKELAEQLSYISSPEERRLLVEKIVSSYEKALSLLNWGVSAVHNPILDSPLSCGNSSPCPSSEWVDNSPKNVSKKRKGEARWSEQVKVGLGTSLEGPLDDGYNWRKYGQKDILKAKFPRGYYRCSHRHSQGCLATKQVQRSDQDPTTFEVTYKGRHTCFHSNKDTFDQFEEKPKPKPKTKSKPKPIKLKQLSFNYRDGIKMQELEPVVDNIFPSFSFPNVEDGNVENNIFMMENNLLGGFSPAFISPATSDFSASPCQMYSFGLDYNVTTPPPESDSNPASVNNSPIGEWDISVDFTDFEANFPLEEPELYA